MWLPREDRKHCQHFQNGTLASALVANDDPKGFGLREWEPVFPRLSGCWRVRNYSHCNCVGFKVACAKYDDCFPSGFSIQHTWKLTLGL